MSDALRIRLLGLTAMLAAVAAGFDAGWGHPNWWGLLGLATVVAMAETAVVHLAFGRQRWTFSLTEAAIAGVIVYRPGAWIAVSVMVGVLIAQSVRGQENLKREFNIAQFGCGAAIAAMVAHLAGGGVVGGISGMAAFWLVNNLLVATAVAIMTQQKVFNLLRASAPLAAVHSAGTSSLGLLAAWLGQNAPLGLLALVVPMLLLWLSYDEQTARAAEARLFAELARLQEKASGRSIDTSAQVVLTAAARLFGGADVEMVLMAADGPVHYSGNEDGIDRRRVDVAALDMPWVMRALGQGRVDYGLDDEHRPFCAAVLGGRERPLAVLIARRPAGTPVFGRREGMLAEVLVKQAESWLSVAELAESRDEALAHVEAAEGAARALGDLGASTAPALVVLRESANRLARLAEVDGPAAVGDIVDELFSVERAVASLLGAIALAAETDLGRSTIEDLPDVPRPVTDWTTTGVLVDEEVAPMIPAPGLPR